MKRTRAQYESAFTRTVGYFSVAVAVSTALEIIVGFVVGFVVSEWSSDVPEVIGVALVTLVLGAVFSGIFAAIGAAIVALILGIGLTALTARMLRQVTDWRGHCAGAFAVGAISATIPLALLSLWLAAPENDGYAFANWLTVLDLAILVLLAGASSALAWYRVWRHPVPTEVELETASTVS